MRRLAFLAVMVVLGWAAVQIAPWGRGPSRVRGALACADRVIYDRRESDRR